MTYLLWPERAEQYLLLAYEADLSAELDEFDEAPHIINQYDTAQGINNHRSLTNTHFNIFNNHNDTSTSNHLDNHHDTISNHVDILTSQNRDVCNHIDVVNSYFDPISDTEQFKIKTWEKRNMVDTKQI